MFAAATRTNASEQYAFAMCAAAPNCGPSGASSTAQAATDRADSTSSSMSAHRCRTAWNEPIGRPNCIRSLA